MMDMDDIVRSYPWSEEVSKERMAEFIFDNMLIKLRKGERDISFFIMVMIKITVVLVKIEELREEMNMDKPLVAGKVAIPVELKMGGI